MSYKKSVEMYRVRKDKYLKEDHHSPIDNVKVKEKFERLNYYPIDEKWNMKLKLHRYDDVTQIDMETSGGQVQHYNRIGYFQFNHPDTGDEVKINLYKGGEHYNFIIRDLTSGEETYGAGRYLNLEEGNNDEYHVDFNLLYSPFCAYSPNYSCPFPPMENWLNVKITAGEKNFPFSDEIY